MTPKVTPAALEAVVRWRHADPALSLTAACERLRVELGVIVDRRTLDRAWGKLLAANGGKPPKPSKSKAARILGSRLAALRANAARLQAMLDAGTLPARDSVVVSQELRAIHRELEELENADRVAKSPMQPADGEALDQLLIRIVAKARLVVTGAPIVEVPAEDLGEEAAG